MTPTSSALHWRHFNSGDFRTSAAFESYDVKPCIDSRKLSTTVASPCQTLCELLAGDNE